MALLPLSSPSASPITVGIPARAQPSALRHVKLQLFDSLGRLIRIIASVACVMSLSTSVLAQQDDTDPGQQVVSPFPETARPHQVLLHPHREQRDKYLWGTFGPPGILDSALGAALGQWMNRPQAWKQDESGYIKRLGSEYAESAISESVKYVLARIRDEDPSFHPCGCSGFRRRALHAIVSPFIAYRFDNGMPQFSAARIAGTAAGSVVAASTWKPTSTSVGAETAHIGTDLLSAMGVDVLREFFFHHKPDLTATPDGR